MGDDNRIENRLQSGHYQDLQELLEDADANYSNLHERLGIKRHKLTRVLNNPKEEGNMEIAKDIANLIGIRASVLINSNLKFGQPNISLLEMENLHFEETTGITKGNN